MSAKNPEQTKALLLGNDPNGRSSFQAHAAEKGITFFDGDAILVNVEAVLEYITHLGGAVVVLLALRADRLTGNLDTNWLDLAEQLVRQSIPVLVTADTEHTHQVAERTLQFMPGSDATADRMVLDEVVRLGRGG